MKTEEIKLYGFGEVGQGFQQYLAKNEDPTRLHTIIVKNEQKERKEVPSKIETTNPNTIKDKEMFAVLELISSAEDAYGIVAENLEIGQPIISANKKLIATHLEKLIQLERENKATFLYEGAVCGSIPIISTLNNLFGHEELKSVSGIFNGSSNYILTKLFDEGISYEEALKQAQDLGFAEADPTSDVGGFDALYKLIIVVAHAFGKIVRPEQVLNIGIENITKEDVEFAKQHQLKIKLIAKSTVSGGVLQLSVLPTLVGQKSELYNVENEYNGVLVDGESIGTHFYKGKGAGSLPTGSVVYADLKALDRGYRYEYAKLNRTSLTFTNETTITVILNTSEPYQIKKLEAELRGVYPLGIFGKRFIAQISLADLIDIKQEAQKNGISILAVENEQIVEQLTASLCTEETLI